MNHATPKMLYFARILIRHEACGGVSSQTENQTALVVVQKLRPPLEELMGNTGFRAAVSRALAVAEEQIPWLRGVRMNDDGTFEEFPDPQDPADMNPPSSGGSVMLASLLGLLGSFIGEILTMQLVLEVWPTLSLNGYFSQPTDHEKTH